VLTNANRAKRREVARRRNVGCAPRRGPVLSEADDCQSIVTHMDRRSSGYNSAKRNERYEETIAEHGGEDRLMLMWEVNSRIEHFELRKAWITYIQQRHASINTFGASLSMTHSSLLIYSFGVVRK